MKPLVSVIIPTYNRAHIIQQTIESLLTQTYDSWECILVDDGSDDNTIEIIKNYSTKDKRFFCFVRPEINKKGPSSCRNIGIQKAKGDYIIFLDSDDLLASFCLEERVNAFKKNNDCDFLVFKMQRFIEKPVFSKKKPLEILRNNHFNNVSSFLQLNSIWQVTSPIYKRNFLNNLEIIRFNESLSNFEDLEMALKILFKTKKYKIFKNIDCFYRNDVNYKKKYKKIDSKKKIITSFIIFLKEIDVCIDNITKLSTKINYKKKLVLGYKKMFLVNIKDHFHIFKKQNKEILRILKSKKYLSYNEIIKYYFVQYFLMKFHKIKGIGIYRLIKYIYQL